LNMNYIFFINMISILLWVGRFDFHTSWH
jgi:hypothetical protein